MKKIFTTFILVAILIACQRKTNTATTEPSPSTVDGTPASSTPICIQQKIDSLKQLPVSNPPSQVDEYDYNGEKVYGFSLGCCDMFYAVYNGNCNYICSPSGGFTGRGDGLCKDFNEKAKLVRIVWKDERKK